MPCPALGTAWIGVERTRGGISRQRAPREGARRRAALAQDPNLGTKGRRDRFGRFVQAPVTVVVQAVTGGRGALRRQVRHAAQPTRLAEERALSTEPGRTGHGTGRAQQGVSLVRLAVAVVVLTIANLVGRDEPAGPDVRRTTDREAVLGALHETLAAGADTVAGLAQPTPRRGREVLVRETIAVVVEAVAQLGDRALARAPGRGVALHAQVIGAALEVAVATPAGRLAGRPEPPLTLAEVLVDLTVAVVVGGVTELGRAPVAGSSGRRRTDGPPVLGADDRSDTTFTDGIAGLSDLETIPELSFVREAIAVVVDPIAGLRRNRRLRARRQGGTQHGATGPALVDPLRATADAGADAAEGGAIRCGDAVVHDPIAVVVVAVAELRRGGAVGLPGGRRALAVGLVHADVTTGAADARRRAGRADLSVVGKEPFVDLAVAVVVEQVAELVRAAEGAAIGVDGAHGEAVETLDDPRPTGAETGTGLSERELVPGEALVGRAVAVVVEAIADLVDRVAERVAGRHTAQTADHRARAARRRAQARSADRQSVPEESVVDDPIAVVVEAITALDAPDEVGPAGIRRTERRAPVDRADHPPRAALTDPVAGFPHQGAIGAPRKAFVHLAVAVVVDPIAADFVTHRHAAGRVHDRGGVADLGPLLDGPRHTHPLDTGTIHVTGRLGIARLVAGQLTATRNGQEHEQFHRDLHLKHHQKLGMNSRSFSPTPAMNSAFLHMSLGALALSR